MAAGNRQYRCERRNAEPHRFLHVKHSIAPPRRPAPPLRAYCGPQNTKRSRRQNTAQPSRAMKISMVVASGVGVTIGGDDRDDQHRVAKILQQEFRRHNSEQRQNKNQHRQFENNSQARSAQSGSNRNIR